LVCVTPSTERVRVPAHYYCFIYYLNYFEADVPYKYLVNCIINKIP
jgi:hypothetical protein